MYIWLIALLLFIFLLIAALAARFLVPARLRQNGDATTLTFSKIRNSGTSTAARLLVTLPLVPVSVLIVMSLFARDWVGAVLLLAIGTALFVLIVRPFYLHQPIKIDTRNATVTIPGEKQFSFRKPYKESKTYSFDDIAFAGVGSVNYLREQISDLPQPLAQQLDQQLQQLVTKWRQQPKQNAAARLLVKALARYLVLVTKDGSATTTYVDIYRTEDLIRLTNTLEQHGIETRNEWKEKYTKD